MFTPTALFPRDEFIQVHQDPRHGRGIMSATIDASSTFRAGAPVPLFTQPIRLLGGFLRSGVEYDVTPDGQRFVAVVMHPPATSAAPALNVFVNWESALHR